MYVIGTRSLIVGRQKLNTFSFRIWEQLSPTWVCGNSSHTPKKHQQRPYQP